MDAASPDGIAKLADRAPAAPVQCAPLRPYQEQALEETRARFRSGKRRVVVVAPTGAGKSVLFAEVTRRHAAQRGRVLIVVHRRELVKQAVKHLASRGTNSVRVIMGGKALGPPDAAVTVAAVQTLCSKQWRGRLPTASLVIWDECHHIKAPSFMAVASAYAESLHLGFTATPQRSDNSPLGDMFESMVVVATVRELMDDGFLVECRVWGPPSDRQQLAADAADAYIEHGEEKRAIVFCANVVHAKDVAQRLTEHGVAAEYVDGTMSAKERDAKLERFATGETRVITNCNLISEGFDVPACKCIVIARGCDSVAMFLQAIGRALRPEPGEDYAVLLDLRGAVHKHGLPDADRKFSLDGDAISTDKENLEQARQCLACGRFFPAKPKCPYCGHVSPLPEPPEVRRERLQRISDAQTDDQRTAYLERLMREARTKHYRAGWAAHRYKVRYHAWPTREAVAAVTARLNAEAMPPEPVEHGDYEDEGAVA